MNRQPSSPRRRHALIEAPSSLGLLADGVETMPTQLLRLGLAQRIGARHARGPAPPDKRSIRDRDTGVLDADALVDWSPRLADAVGAVLDAGEFPVVAGGDCTIVLGSMLALRRRGRYGLLFIDGNADFFQPEAEPHGEGASMDLALATGFGPALLTTWEGHRPLVRPTDVVAFGYRDHEDQARYGSQPLPAELRAWDLPAVRRQGAAAAARAAVEHLSRPDLEGFFVHVDVDCLDDALMPAVDFRLPGGLSWTEFVTVLRIALDSPRAVGLEIAIYNPRLDPDGAAGRALVEHLAAALQA